MSLRGYQREAVDAVQSSWDEHRSTLLVMATGTGKTRTASEIVRTRSGRTLWLAHREELIKQAADALTEHAGLTCEVEMADQRAGHWGSQVVVGSVATMKGKRLKRWYPEAFSTIVVDEAHHATARTYRGILRAFPKAKVLGLTATPDRGDGVGLRAVFEDCAFEYGIRRAIDEGYLVPIRQRTIECADLDLSDVKVVAGDLAKGEVERRLSLEAVLHQIAGPLVKESEGRQTIVFTAGVKQAEALVGVLGGYMPASQVASISGETPKELRRDRLGAYKRGELRVLVNCAVLTEGFDAPETSCIAMARPTKSRALYTQCVGRGTRLPVGGLLPHEGKRDCLVLDFRGNAGRHTLVSPADVLAGRPVDEDTRKRVQQLEREGAPTHEALEQAEEEAAERQRRAEEAERRRTKLRAEVTYLAQDVDPFGLVDRGSEKDRRGPRATDGQVRFLQQLGVKLNDYQPSRREASKIIDSIKARRTRGVCTYKTAQVLSRYELPTEISQADAGVILDRLASRYRWRPPADVLRKMADWAHERVIGPDAEAAE